MRVVICRDSNAVLYITVFGLISGLQLNSSPDNLEEISKIKESINKDNDNCTNRNGIKAVDNTKDNMRRLSKNDILDMEMKGNTNGYVKSAEEQIQDDLAKNTKANRKLAYMKKLMEQQSKKIVEDREERRRAHKLFYSRSILHKDATEISDSKYYNLLRTAVNNMDDVQALAVKKAFELYTYSELKGKLLNKFFNDFASVRTTLNTYANVVANKNNIDIKEVTPKQVALFGSYILAFEKAKNDAYQDKLGYANYLVPWPGIGYSGYIGRLQDDLWSYYNDNKEVDRTKLSPYQDVIYFPGIGEVIVHKSAKIVEKYLLEAWARDRHEFQTPLDERKNASEIMKTQGLGMLTQIIGIISKLIQQNVEVRGNADSNYTYPYLLPYFSDYYINRTLEFNDQRISEINNKYIVTIPLAHAQNNVIVGSRLRQILTMSAFYDNWLNEHVHLYGAQIIPHKELSDKVSYN